MKRGLSICSGQTAELASMQVDVKGLPAGFLAEGPYNAGTKITQQFDAPLTFHLSFWEALAIKPMPSIPTQLEVSVHSNLYIVMPIDYY